jgi:hypothetical protein
METWLSPSNTSSILLVSPFTNESHVIKRLKTIELFPMKRIDGGGPRGRGKQEKSQEKKLIV